LDKVAVDLKMSIDEPFIAPLRNYALTATTTFLAEAVIRA
jgi:hypothetical protein